jgi:cytochrome c peroxidase
MYSYIKTITRKAYLIISLSLLLLACAQKKEEQTITPHALIEEYLISQLDSAIFYLEKVNNSVSLSTAQMNFINARISIKKAEPILSFTDQEHYKTLFQPNILKVVEEDATDIKKIAPKGFQVLEEILFTDSIDWSGVEYQVDFLSNRLKLIQANTSLDYFKLHHFLWLMRDEFVRIATTGITGFDSPVLGQSLEESAIIYNEMKKLIALYEPSFKNKELFNEWMIELEGSSKDLNANFDLFDRYKFIQTHTNRQFEMWNRTVKDWGVVFPFELAISNSAPSLFDSTTFNVGYFSDRVWAEITKEKINLGRKLFNDSQLSIDGSLSCSSCHQKEIGFTDGLTVSENQTRNSPTMTYAGFQKAFFYDARTGNLEGQIVDVVNNQTEFHSSIENLIETVKSDSNYINQFGEVYAAEPSDLSIRNAIAAYIRSLAPFNSRFDQSISGKKEALTVEEVNGFNLFMGKAQCATCHFPPLFNGTVPPNFSESEMELLGVPEKNVTSNAKIDDDLGRYNLFKTEERKYFFKTPTIRNVALTAPYMHNGVFETLDNVMEFYDLGGGAGVGINLEHQTLPAEPLNLTEEEEANIIAFMKTLTDQ